MERVKSVSEFIKTKTNITKETKIFAPQAGPQQMFLSSKADIAFYGGAAGGGKTFGLLLEPVRHIDNPKFTAIIFRRTASNIRTAGSIWDEALSIYPLCGGHPRQTDLDVKFPSGARLSFKHLEHESDVLTHQGAQYALICFDELTHFTESQFFYLLSRNRSTCGVRPYVRATTNPDKDSWVRGMIDWWIDEDGYPIPERSGVIRWFVRVNNEFIWADNKEDLSQYNIDMARDGEEPEIVELAKSFTFIAATLHDNRILIKNDPGYVANLESQDDVQKGRLLYGNWNISYGDLGAIISRDDFERYSFLKNPDGSTIFPNFKMVYMVVDGASKTKEANDYSVIGVYGKTHDNRIYILDWFRGKLEAPDLRKKIISMYTYWNNISILFNVAGVWIETQASGTAMYQFLQLDGIPVFELKAIKDKYTRLSDSLGIIKSKFVYVPYEAVWLMSFFIELESFRADGKHIVMKGETLPHDDQVDVLAYGTGTQINLITPVTVYRKKEPKKKVMGAHNWI